MPSSATAQRFMAAAEARRFSAGSLRASVADMPTISAVRLVEYFNMSRRMPRNGPLRRVTSVSACVGNVPTTSGGVSLMPWDRAIVANTSPA